MRLLTPRRLVAATLFLSTGFLIVTTDSVASGYVGKKDKDKDKKEKEKEKEKAKGGKAGPDLHKAFDKLTNLSVAPAPGKDAARVFDHAKRLYRESIQVYREGDTRRAGELAAAANDAARGLEHLRRATAPPVAGLPEPPVEFDRPLGVPKGKGPPPLEGGAAAERGPWSESLDALTVARERLGWFGESAPVTGPARDTLDAAKSVFAQARTAYEGGEYRKATELARAAEAWSHVPEHLTRAGSEGPATPPIAPEPKRKGPGVPPPPPAIKD